MHGQCPCNRFSLQSYTHPASLNNHARASYAPMRRWKDGTKLKKLYLHPCNVYLANCYIYITFFLYTLACTHHFQYPCIFEKLEIFSLSSYDTAVKHMKELSLIDACAQTIIGSASVISYSDPNVNGNARLMMHEQKGTMMQARRGIKP